MIASYTFDSSAICWLWSSTCTEWRNQRMQLYDRERQNQISFRISCNTETLPKYPKPVNRTHTVTGPDECNRIHSHIHRLLQSLVLFVVVIVVISIGSLSHPCRFVYNDTHVLPAAALVMRLYYSFTPFKLYSRISYGRKRPADYHWSDCYSCPKCILLLLLLLPFSHTLQLPIFPHFYSSTRSLSLFHSSTIHWIGSSNSCVRVPFGHNICVQIII